jgi:hypothetical protein
MDQPTNIVSYGGATSRLKIPPDKSCKKLLSRTCQVGFCNISKTWKKVVFYLEEMTENSYFWLEGP